MYTFIVNPNARTGLGSRVWSSIEARLVKEQIPYQVFFTKYQNHATKIIRNLTSSGQHMTIVALGGDGTINEVVNGICDLSNVTLGYIPIGSSNDFSRGLGLSCDPHKALTAILSPKKFAYVNIGAVTHEGKTRRFAVSAGLGFDAEVCYRISFSKLKAALNRIKLGKLAYALVAVLSLLLQTPKKMTITLDNETPVNFDRVYFTALMNQKYEGGGFMFCPKANPGDDVLDLIVVEGLSKLKILCLLPTAFFGKHTRFHGIHTYRCENVKIESDASLPLHTDGETVLYQTELLGRLEPEKLRVIVS